MKNKNLLSAILGIALLSLSLWACQKQEVAPERENLTGKPLSAEEFKDFKNRMRNNSALVNWVTTYTDFSRQRVQVLSKLPKADFDQLLADVQNAGGSEKQKLFYSRLNLQEKQIEFQANAKQNYLKISAENRQIMRNLTETQFTELIDQMWNAGRTEAETCYTSDEQCLCMRYCNLAYEIDMMYFSEDADASFDEFLGCLVGC